MGNNRASKINKKFTTTFNMIEYTMILLAINVQIEEINRKISETGETHGSIRQLHIFEDIKNKLHDSYIREVGIL